MRNLLTISGVFALIAFFVFSGNNHDANARLSPQDVAQVAESHNIITNPGFEGNITDWVSTGGSLTTETVTPMFGGSTGVWTPAASGNTLETKLISVPTGMFGRSCSIYFDYIWTGVTGELEVEVIDQAAAPLFNRVLEPSTVSKGYQVFFTCPDTSSSQIKLSIKATAASAQLKLDNVFMGIGKNAGGAIAYKFENKFLSANITAPVTSIPDLAYNNLVVGKTYRVSLLGDFQAISNEPANVGIRALNGTTPVCVTSYTVRQTGGTIDEATQRASCVRSFVATDTNLTFEAFGDLASNNRINGSGAADSTNVQLEEIITGNTVTLETKSQFWQGALKGTNAAHVTSLSKVFTNGTPREATSADLELTGTEGPTAVKIACDAGNAATGIDCGANNESFGITFRPVSTGKHEVCFGFASYINGSNAQGAYLGFHIAKTNSVSGSIEKAYTNNSSVHGTYVGGSNYVTMNNHDVCVYEDLSSGEDATFKLYYEIDGPYTNVVNAAIGGMNDSTATSYDKRMNYKIRNLDEQKPTPVFTELTNSLDSKVSSTEKTVMHSCTFNFIASPSSITIDFNLSEACDWIDSTQRLGVGRGWVTPKAGIFSSKPNCSATYILAPTTVSAAVRSCNTDTYTGTDIGVSCIVSSSVSAGFYADAGFTLICHGKTN